MMLLEQPPAAEMDSDSVGSTFTKPSLNDKTPREQEQAQSCSDISLLSCPSSPEKRSTLSDVPHPLIHEEDLHNENNTEECVPLSPRRVKRAKSQSITCTELSKQKQEWEKETKGKQRKVKRTNSLDISKHRATRKGGKNGSDNNSNNDENNDTTQVMRRTSALQQSLCSVPFPEEKNEDETEVSSSTQAPTHKRRLTSILKKQDAQQQQQQQQPQERRNRSISFHVNEKDLVICSVKLVRKISTKYHKLLWWNADDLDERYDRDTEMAALVEDSYSKLLQQAFDSTSHASEDEPAPKCKLCFSSMTKCSIARGLEGDVFPTLFDRKREHRRVVLDAQSFLGGDTSSGHAKQFLRLQSRKFSISSHLVAHEIALFDQQAVPV